MEENRQEAVEDTKDIALKQESKKHKVLKEILDWVICIIIAYVLFVIINNFLFAMPQVKQTSMYPTIESGERVLVNCNKILSKPYDRGEIIVFAAPYMDINKDTIDVKASYPDIHGFDAFAYYTLGFGKISLVKRVVGIAGDHIEITEDGKVYVNGMLEDSWYIDDPYTPQLGIYTDLVVPEGYVFAMGDNRDGSKDCRAFGCIPVDKIEGKVIARIWPLTKFGGIDKDR